MTPYPLITVVGGSGFVGRHLIKQLTAAGYRVRVLCRDTVAAEFLTTAGTVGQVVPQYADITRPDTLVGKFEGSWAVVNLVSTLYEHGRQKFDALNVQGAERIAQAARKAGAVRFIQISALGIEKAPDSRYASTKLTGEQAVRAAFPEATFLRPSLIVGPEDGFFQRFARMAQLAPALPLPRSGKTKFQPILVQDVASCILAALQKPETSGHTYELGGPEILTMREMLELLRRITSRRFALLPLPLLLAKLIAIGTAPLPIAPPITLDQLRLLAHDNIVSRSATGMGALGVTPTSVTEALPALLRRYVKG